MSAAGLIPQTIYDYAERLGQGTIPIEPFADGSPRDDEKMLPFLEAVASGDEARALNTLAHILKGWPLRLHHPYAWEQARHLFMIASNPDSSAREQANEWLIKLIQAWAMGMTGGYNVFITKPAPPPGQMPALFPHLSDRAGWFRTLEARQEIRAAGEFARKYEDLMARLKPLLPWRSLRYRFKEGLTAALYDAAEKIAPSFEQFKKDWDISTEPMPKKTLLLIARAGLTERRGGNPSHRVACGLMATLPWCNIRGHAMKATPSLIESTLETLRRYRLR